MAGCTSGAAAGAGPAWSRRSRLRPSPRPAACCSSTRTIQHCTPCGLLSPSRSPSCPSLLPYLLPFPSFPRRSQVRCYPAVPDALGIASALAAELGEPDSPATHQLALQLGGYAVRECRRERSEAGFHGVGKAGGRVGGRAGDSRQAAWGAARCVRGGEARYALRAALRRWLCAARCSAQAVSYSGLAEPVSFLPGALYRRSRPSPGERHW
jgi:hypothetical protein